MSHAPPPPPRVQDLPAGTRLVAGLGFATILPDFDFETYSEAGWVWNDTACDWDRLEGAPGTKTGLAIVGAGVYATHPSTEILSLKYDLKDGRGARHWRPGLPPPTELFEHIARGGLLEAHNSSFEHWIWQHVAVPKLGWPPLPLRQLRCSMAKARAHALPGALADLCDVLETKIRKDKDGTRLLNKFSKPRKPTKKDARRRIRPEEDPADAQRLYDYNGIDIESEAECSSRIPDLSPDELEYWLCDQEINYRGVAVDVAAINDCITIIKQVFARYNAELSAITGGAITAASQTQKLSGWLAGRGVYMSSMDEEAVTEALKNGGRDWQDQGAKRALEIRAKTGSASIKKLFTLKNTTSIWQRIHDLINYHAARTGRDGGKDAQTQNLPKSGPDVWLCKSCNHFFGAHRLVCPWCNAVNIPDPLKPKPREWTAECYDDAFAVIATRSMDMCEAFFGDAFELIIGCIRGLLIAAPGHDLIASDYSQIESVVMAAMAGCEWRLQVFRDGKDIYLKSASDITGNTYESYIDYKEKTTKHHPHRQPFGKIPELALGYGGWVGAMIAFGAEEFMTEDQMRSTILRWRDASPEICEFWGGQFRGLPWESNCYHELYGLEGAAIQAIQNPGERFTVKADHPASLPITFVVLADVLYMILPDGKELTYHHPRLEMSTRGPYKGMALSITYWGWNSNPKMGAMGWTMMETYGPKLAENAIQGIARNILRDAVVRLMHAGYSVVLRVHDEIVAEVLKLWGTIEQFESIMHAHKEIYSAWPVIAKGGYRAVRYRKD